MSQSRTPGKQWTASEDEKLIEAVKKYGDNTESWKTIALSVPGRTNKACRKRWKHSLHPSIKKTPWEVDEDELLLKLYAQHPGRWAHIATHIPGRTDDACAKRYREALDPNLKKDDWTNEEDERLLDGVDRHGPAWGKVGEELGRSGLGCRNRWRLLERRKNAAVRRAVKGEDAISERRKRKRKRGTEDAGDTGDDGELSDEGGDPGPSRRRRTSSPPPRLHSPPVPPSASQTSDPSWGTTSEDMALSTPASSNILDPSIIGMALGKCGCGCASGKRPCNCSSTNPSLNLPSDSDILASLDWNQLFPYLHAELPTVFVDPPPLPPALQPPSQGKTSASDMQSALDSISQTEPRCLCQTCQNGCHCSKNRSATLSSDHQTLEGLSNESRDKPPCCQTSGASTAILFDTNAEAAKLVLDYAAFLVQHQQSAKYTYGASRPSPPTSHLRHSNTQPRSFGIQSCQMPASQVLIGIIEKYQQRKSNPPSNFSSGLMSNVPLPGGCDCGCGSARAGPSTQPESFVPTVSLGGTPMVVAPPPVDVVAVRRGGCCSNRSSDASKPPPFASFSVTQEVPMDTTASSIGNRPTETASFANFPSYIPGCGCGCVAGAPEGTCSCGCVGACYCASQGMPNPTQDERRSALVPLLAAIETAVASTAPPSTQPGSCCCGHKAKEYEPSQSAELPQTMPMPSNALDFNVASAATGGDLDNLMLPNFIPGCGCGCADGAPEGSCSCGCFGICQCASWASASQPDLADTVATDATVHPTISHGVPTTVIPPGQNSLDALSGSAGGAGIGRSPDPCRRGCIGFCQCNSDQVVEPLAQNDVGVSWPVDEQVFETSDREFRTRPEHQSQRQPDIVFHSSPAIDEAIPIFSPSISHSATHDIAPASSSRSCCQSKGVEAQEAAHTSPASDVSSTPASFTDSPDITTPSAASGSKSANVQHRLSAQLAAPLPGYACGHPDCWIESSRGSSEQAPYLSRCSTVSFRTSGELMLHRRSAHGAEDDSGDGPGRGTGPSDSWLFRCGLVGCEKGWKSINGIQYHLQLSKAHFHTSWGGRDSPSHVGGAAGEKKRKASQSPRISHEEESLRPRKMYKCPHEGCSNVYKQQAGLKYHLVHGHPHTRPIQLASISPLLST